MFIPLTEAQRFWTYRLLTRVDTMDLKSIFTSKIEADSDDVIDHGRRQVQEILREQMHDQKQAKPAGQLIDRWMYVSRLISRSSLETVDEPPHPVENGLRSVSTGIVHKFSDRLTLFSPYILQDAEPSPYVIGEHLVASSSKLVVIDKILGDILPKGERVLIFSVCDGSRTVSPR